MTDTIFVILNDTIAQTDHELLTQVREFYDASWEKLTRLLYILIGLIAVGVPVAIAIIQRSLLKANEQRIANEVKESVLQKVKPEIEKEIKYLQGNVFHLQAMTFETKNDYFQVVLSALEAILDYTRSGTPDAIGNLKELHSDIKEMIDKITPKQLMEIFKKKGSSPDRFIALLLECESSEYIKNEIDELNDLLTNKLVEGIPKENSR